ncbi:putative 5-formyltetrahydrofolate cyclo-ligase [Colletotrichum sp. SAR 10_99]|nr:putative 5-formyltetrahydrofolate cyclo-ligase [Colletotrichum sp. SAR 10_96]KAI8257143.1 putative 5-formyltetrahydrofolate cyclo-ligase [Colletotrichum sp. SAR 10_98]KAJ5009840.1 putative 5-formyltetrahydrofolate cyclo-ligase [Colletotrichum sp. SAR 10_99]
MGSALVAAKKQLRSVMRDRLAGVAHESINIQSRTVCETLKTFKPYVEAQRVSVFLSMSSGEIQTDDIVRHALSSGKQVYVPYLHKSPFSSEETPPRVMDMVRLRDLQDYESLQPDKWGIPSIDPATIDQRQRVLGVAFDIDPQSGSLRRLGHGKGFYDLFIRRYAAKYNNISSVATKPLMLYGLALSEQFLSQPSDSTVPVAQHDQPLDGVVLGSGEVRRPAESFKNR